MKVSRQLDMIAAIVGAVVMLLLIPWLTYRGFHPIYLVTVGVGLGSVGLYLITRRKMVNADDTPRNKATTRSFLFGSLFLCLLAWLVFILRPEQYIKPTTYYTLMACATGLAFYGTIKGKSKTQSWAVVGIACIIGLSHIWTEHLLFPNSLIGLDPWIHQMRTMGQPNWPGIGGSYSLMHVCLRSTIDAFGISYKWASLIFVGSTQTAATAILVFLLGRMLWNTKVGCVASLMVASANWVVFFGEWIIPNSLGAIYSLAVAYLVLKINRGSTKWLLVPVVLLFLVAYTTHFIAVMWVLGTFACLWVVPAMLGANMRKVARSLVVPSLGVMVLALLLRFTVMGNDLHRTIGDSIFTPNYGITYAIGQTPVSSTPSGISGTPNGSPGNEQTTEPVTEPVVAKPVFERDGNALGEMTVDSLGMLLYVGLAILGCLVMLRGTAAPAQKAFIVLGLVILSIGFFPPLFGFSLIEHRWWYFAEVLLAMPLGVALVSLVSTGRWSVVLVTITAIAITFLSTIGLMSNMTNRTLSPNLIARYAFTNDEIEGLAVAQTYNPQIIGTDPMFSPFVFASTTVAVVSVTGEILSCNFRDTAADVLLLRNALHKEPFGFGGGTIFRLKYNLVNVAIAQGYTKVWENKDIVCLVRK